MLLAADLAGIEPEVREQAVERRDAGEHPRRVPFAAGAPDRLVRRVREDPRMAVEDRADPSPATDGREHPLDDLFVGVVARLADAIRVDEVLGAGSELEQPFEGQEIGDENEVFLGDADRTEGLARDVRRPGKADADDGERTRRASTTGRG